MNIADFHIYVPDHFLKPIFCAGCFMAYSQRLFGKVLLLLGAGIALLV
jgi:hypothetical protein